jgi:hypothetical protein
VTSETAAAQQIDAPGRYDLPEEEYHADPMRHLGGSLSSTVARKLLPPSCPALARHAMLHPEHRDTFDLGSVTHSLTLGRGCEIVEVPADAWNTKAVKEIRAKARTEGKVALLTKELHTAEAMRDAVHANRIAHLLLTLPRGLPEQTLIWREDGTWCRAMLDRWPDPATDLRAVVDLKTTAGGLDDDSLSKTVYNYGYHQQAEWYSRGYRAVHGKPAEFYFVFVAKDPPHLVRVFPLADELLADARARNNEALQIWRECQESGDWPAYENTLDPIGAPRWANLREDYS